MTSRSATYRECLKSTPGKRPILRYALHCLSTPSCFILYRQMRITECEKFKERSGGNRSYHSPLSQLHPILHSHRYRGSVERGMLRISGCNFMNGRLGREGMRGGGRSCRFNDRAHPRPYRPSSVSLSLSLPPVPERSLSLDSSPNRPPSTRDPILCLPRRLRAHVRSARVCVGYVAGRS